MKTVNEAPTAGVVIHLNEADPIKHGAVLRNIRNLMDALGAGTDLELVVHGPGISIVLPDSPHRETLRALQHGGLIVDACQNTLRSMEIGPEQLVPDSVIVPSGIAHLVIRQRNGWAYLRP
ncbi:DsrE family protein [Leifsonia sp. NPDC014704]|uniref:DsrE family protein n=1 Tax=unclassified Leifsonia TaxID=2663824 RepID=UPI000F1BA018|nr:DsrE family protein [Leifsonia sp. NCR5]